MLLSLNLLAAPPILNLIILDLNYYDDVFVVSSCRRWGIGSRVVTIINIIIIIINNNKVYNIVVDENNNNTT